LIWETDLTLGSLFSGIGGFELAASRNGIKPVWASEIEAAPISILKKHFPEMKHLGDITKINGAEIEPVDVITGGFPCQDCSIAGKREGLDGKRSGLFFEAIRIIKEMLDKTSGEYPKYIVIENVPGLLSSNNGNDIKAVFDALNDTGFIIDANILDAQNFGVPQRRRRLFLVCVNIDHVMNNGKMILSESVTLQLISELLLNILGVQLKGLGIEPQGLGAVVPLRSVNGLKRTMTTFSLTSENRLNQLQNILNEITGKLAKEQDGLVSNHGEILMEDFFIQKGTQLGLFSQKESPLISTEKSLKKCLDEGLRLMKECIISTGLKQITMKEICLSLETLMNTLAHTNNYINLELKTSPNYLNYFQWIKLYLIEARAYINAGQKYCKSIKYVGGDNPLWGIGQRLFIIQSKIERCFRGESAGEILFKPQSLSGNFEKGENKGERTAGDIKNGAKTAIGVDLYNQNLTGAVINTIRGSRADYDHLGGGVLIVNDQGGSVINIEKGDVSPTLRSQTKGHVPLILENHPNDSRVKIKEPHAVFNNSLIRRLTPLEAERLMGFPDNYTEYGHDGRKISDSARYKALGNSVAIPCVEFIMKRMVKKYGGTKNEG